MKKTICTLLLTTICSIVTGQTFTLEGKITDFNNNEGIAYANIALQTTDSVFVTGTTTDIKGNFTIAKLSSGSYLLITTCMGYDGSIIRLDNLTKNIHIGEIPLSETNQVLDEVTVSASRIVSKVDRQLVFPTESQVKASNSGYELLNQMMLPGLKIDTQQNNISSVSGGNVEIRINNIKASTADILALRPDEVIRIEHIDEPGIRYADQDVQAVINFIVKRQSSGIAAGVNLMNAFQTGFGNDNIYIKANHNRSEFGLNYYVSYRDYTERRIDQTQHFELPDHSIRSIDRVGINSPFSYVMQNVELSYNFTETDKYVFNAALRGSFYNSQKRGDRQIIREVNKPDIYSFSDPKDRNSTPSLDLYYQINLPHKQALAVNVVGTYIGTDYTHNYKEYIDNPEQPLSTYGYTTDGKKYSLIGEAIYDKEFEPFKLTGGLQYTQGYTKNVYTGSTEAITNLHNSNMYAYVQIQGKLQKLNYVLGVGGSRQTFDQAGNGFEYYTFRPSLTLSYPVFKGANLRYNFRVNPSLPSLSSLSDIRQQKNDIEVNVGNPDLEPYRTISNQLRFTYQLPRFNMQATGSYVYRKNPIMTEIHRTNEGPLGYTFEYWSANQKSLTQLGGQVYAQYYLIKDILAVSAYGGFNRFISKGNNYDHYYSTWYGGGQLNLTLNNWSFYGGVWGRYNNLFGENIGYGENSSNLGFNYKYKNVRFGAGMLYPFQAQGWGAGGKQISKLVQNKSWTYIKDNANMITLSFAWNITYGRKHKAGEKKLYNSDNDSGIMK